MTLKQTQAIKNLVETNGNVAKAMLQAGYSKSVTNQPSVLTRSKAFQELFRDKLGDDKLLKVHEEGLMATKIHTSPTEPDQEVTDHDARYKYLALAYKVKGIGEGTGATNNTQINITLGNDGYIPPNNTQQLKPSLKIK